MEPVQLRVTSQCTTEWHTKAIVTGILNTDYKLFLSIFWHGQPPNLQNNAAVYIGKKYLGHIAWSMSTGSGNHISLVQIDPKIATTYLKWTSRTSSLQVSGQTSSIHPYGAQSGVTAHRKPHLLDALSGRDVLKFEVGPPFLYPHSTSGIVATSEVRTRYLEHWGIQDETVHRSSRKSMWTTTTDDPSALRLSQIIYEACDELHIQEYQFYGLYQVPVLSYLWKVTTTNFVQNGNIQHLRNWRWVTCCIPDGKGTLNVYALDVDKAHANQQLRWWSADFRNPVRLLMLKRPPELLSLAGNKGWSKAYVNPGNSQENFWGTLGVCLELSGHPGRLYGVICGHIIEKNSSLPVDYLTSSVSIKDKDQQEAGTVVYYKHDWHANPPEDIALCILHEQYVHTGGKDNFAPDVHTELCKVGSITRVSAPVMKTGQVTGTTYGEMLGWGMLFEYVYEGHYERREVPAEALAVEGHGFALEGDSGSLVTSLEKDDGKVDAYGLVYAGLRLVPEVQGLPHKDLVLVCPLYPLLKRASIERYKNRKFSIFNKMPSVQLQEACSEVSLR